MTQPVHQQAGGHEHDEHADGADEPPAALWVRRSAVCCGRLVGVVLPPQLPFVEWVVAVVRGEVVDSASGRGRPARARVGEGVLIVPGAVAHIACRSGHGSS